MRWYPNNTGSIRLFERSQVYEVSPPSPRRAIGGSAQSSTIRRMLAALAVTTLTGCAIHPIPDDVSPLPTEAIVSTARCEMRLGIEEKVDQWFRDLGIDRIRFKPYRLAQDIKTIKKLYSAKADLDDMEDYLAISVAYEWTFDITETDQVDGSVGFKLPFVHPGSLDVGASGKVITARRGNRAFKNQDTFSRLLTEDWYKYCNDIPLDPGSAAHPDDVVNNLPIPRPENPIYPITGSIGLRKAVKTFLNVAQQGGGLDTFTDELTFTTTLDGKVGSTLTLSPVPKQFRLVSGSANLAGNRVDLHKVKISLAFPKARPAQKTTKQRGKELDKQLSEVKGGYQLNTNWRAAYALCVVDGKSREEELKGFRLTAPEVYCLDSTDAFYPRGDGVKNSLRTGRVEDLMREQSLDSQRKLDDQKRVEEQRKLNEQKRLDGQRRPGDRPQ